MSVSPKGECNPLRDRKSLASRFVSSSSTDILFSRFFRISSSPTIEKEKKSWDNLNKFPPHICWGIFYEDKHCSTASLHFCFFKEKSLRALAGGKGFISDDGLLHNQQLPSALPFHEKGESFLVLFLLYVRTLLLFVPYILILGAALLNAEYS
jgi:hypothetical protein